MEAVYLVLIREAETHTLHLQADISAVVELTKLGHEFRCSPVYALWPQEVSLPDAQSFYVAFFYYGQAFTQIGELVTSLAPELQPYIWFSHGLASIVVMCNDRKTIEAIRSIRSESLRAIEIWHIDDNIVEPIEIWTKPVQSSESVKFQFTKHPNLEFDTEVVVDSLQLSINRAAARASYLAPELLPFLYDLVSQISEILAGIYELSHPKKPGLPDADDPVARLRRLNTLTDYLIQLNSAFSYVSNQAFTGGPPILETECSYPPYTLLGIGTAFLSLIGFVGFVERVLQDFPVADTIRQRYSSLPGAEVSRGLDSFKREIWTHHSLDIDTHLTGVTAEPMLPHLVYFSGRLGFKETHFAISAPVQSVHACDGVRWSLMTLSHELMHAHVRDLLSAILRSPNPEMISENAFEQYHAKLCEYHKGGGPEVSLIDTLRLGILNYCVFRYGCDRLADQLQRGEKSTSRKEDFKVPDADRLLDWLRSYYRSINEIMAHVLDYHYFFNAKPSVYLQALWLSWSTVPAVLENLEHYILRTVVTVSTKTNGTIDQRFEAALGITAEYIVKLSEAHPDNILLQCARSYVQDGSRVRRLRILFLPHSYLAELTATLLVSNHIHTALITLSHDAEPSGEGYKYSIDTAEFQGKPVEAPVAFVAARLLRALQEAKEELSLEYTSAWLFLALASAVREDWYSA